MKQKSIRRGGMHMLQPIAMQAVNWPFWPERAPRRHYFTDHQQQPTGRLPVSVLSSKTKLFVLGSLPLQRVTVKEGSPFRANCKAAPSRTVCKSPLGRVICEWGEGRRTQRAENLLWKMSRLNAQTLMWPLKKNRLRWRVSSLNNNTNIYKEANNMGANGRKIIHP